MKDAPTRHASADGAIDPPGRNLRFSTRLARRLLLRTIERERDPHALATVSDWLARQRLGVEARLRQLEYEPAPIPTIASFDTRETLQRSVLRDRAPWTGIVPSRCEIPGMIADEERQYYEYLGRFYSGAGAVLELGPWLGCSTQHLVVGLAANPRFSGRRLHVVDAFVWYDFMDAWYTASDPPAPGESFRHLFERYVAPFAAHLDVRTERIAPDRLNASLPPLTWVNGPIELCVVDCGRTIEVNEAWFSRLAPHFIPDRTLIVMQDWQLFKEIPVRWYNQTQLFTAGKGRTLDLVHELARGSVASFLFRGC